MGSLVYYDRLISNAMSIKGIDKIESYSRDGKLNVLRRFLILLEYSGHGIPWIGVNLLVIYSIPERETKQFFCNLMLGLIIDLAVVGLLKMIVRRPRPVYNVDDMFATVSVDRYSFPSGHSTRAAMVAFLFSLFWTNSALVVLGFVWATMVAVSRVVLGRHHVSDVLVGVIIGYFQYCFVRKVWLAQETCMALTNVYSLIKYISP